MRDKNPKDSDYQENIQTHSQVLLSSFDALLPQSTFVFVNKSEFVLSLILIPSNSSLAANPYHVTGRLIEVQLTLLPITAILENAEYGTKLLYLFYSQWHTCNLFCSASKGPRY